MTHERDERRFPAIELPASRARTRDAIRDELRFHVEERAADLIANGIDPAAAQQQALREFGDLDRAGRDLEQVAVSSARRSLVAGALTDLGTDLRHTLRALARRPGFSAIAALTLALGIGANAVIFGLVDRLVLSPPPHIRQPDAVHRLAFDEAQPQSGRITWVGASLPMLEALRVPGAAFEAVAAHSTVRAFHGTGADARELVIQAVTPDYFALLGALPSRGRWLDTETSQDPRAAVISDATWRNAFGAAADVLGRSFDLNGRPFTVVGVAPAGFTGDGMEAVDAWVPLRDGTLGLEAALLATRRMVTVLARLREGVSAAQAEAEATGRYRAVMATLPNADSTAHVVLRSLIPGRSAAGALTPDATVALWLQGVSLAVLLIALANVINLLLLRAVERQRDTAVRLALGIGRGRLLRHLLLESAVLAAVGGAAALALARWLTPALWAIALPMRSDHTAALDTILRVTLAAVACAALLMTALPALLPWRLPVTGVLRERTRGATRGRSPLGEGLVVVQVMLTVTLLVGAGLFVRSLVNANRLDMGFALDRTLIAQIEPQRLDIPAAELAGFTDAALASVRQLPGVEAAALSQSAPYRPSYGQPFRLPGHEQLPGVGPQGLGYPTYFAVTPDFFRALGLRLLAGRGFSDVDRDGTPRVMVIDATMAAAFWPGASPLGQCVRLGADTMPCTTVIGVVQDTRRAIAGQQHSLRYYLPLAQAPTADAQRYLFVRTAGRPDALIGPVKTAIAAAHASAPFADVFPMERLLDWQTRQWRLGSTVLVVFGVLSIVVATLGLYGVVAFDAARQRRELAVRRALGATRRHLVSLVVWGATRRALLGVVLGSIGAVLLGRRLAALLFQTSPFDAVIYAGVVLLVLGATAAASAIPAWRAARVDPAEPLKME